MNFKIKHKDIPLNLPFDHWMDFKKGIAVHTSLSSNWHIVRMPEAILKSFFNKNLQVGSFIVELRRQPGGFGMDILSEGERITYSN